MKNNILDHKFYLNVCIGCQDCQESEWKMSLAVSLARISNPPHSLSLKSKKYLPWQVKDELTSLSAATFLERNDCTCRDTDVKPLTGVWRGSLMSVMCCIFQLSTQTFNWRHVSKMMLMLFKKGCWSFFKPGNWLNLLNTTWNTTVSIDVWFWLTLFPESLRDFVLDLVHERSTEMTHPYTIKMMRNCEGIKATSVLPKKR